MSIYSTSYNVAVVVHIWLQSHTRLSSDKIKILTGDWSIDLTPALFLAQWMTHCLRRIWKVSNVKKTSTKHMHLF